MLTKSQVIEKIIKGVNPDTSGWRFEVNENGYLIGMQNFVDAKWIKLFGKAGLKETVKLIIKFDESKSEAAYLTERGTITWQVGIPTISWNAYKHRGQTWGINRKMAFGMKETGELGKIYDYTMNFNDIAPEVRRIVEESGWVWKRDFSDPSIVIAAVFIAIALLGVMAVIIILVLKGLGLFI